MTLLERPLSTQAETMTFGEWLRGKRESRGISQRVLAARSGLSAGMIARLEGDDVGFSPESLRLLSIGLALDGATEEDLEALHREVRVAAAGLLDEYPAGQVVREEQGRYLADLERHPDLPEVVHHYSGVSEEGRELVKAMLEKLYDQERRRREGEGDAAEK